MNNIVPFSSVILSGLCLCTASPSNAQMVQEAALRSALQLAQTPECASATKPLSIVAMPANDDSESLSSTQIESIRSDFLTAFTAELPTCARLIDAVTAFGTVSFMTEVDSSGRLTVEQQNLIESRLQNAHSIFSLQIERNEESYRATAVLTAIDTVATISVTRYDLPQEQTSNNRGAYAVSEKTGLTALAEELLNGIHPIRALYVTKGLYQDTDKTFGYGTYLAKQFLAALTQARNQKVFGTDFPIKFTENISARGENEYAVTLRYYLCGDEKSANIVLSAQAPNGETNVFTQDLSLELLPAGMTYKPSNTKGSGQSESFDALTPKLQNPKEADLGVVTVSPSRVTTSDLLTVSAEPPANCNPFFFDLAPGGRLTPLPLNIFDVTEIRPGLVRYDNDAASKYGITIQAEDERGSHSLGFICQPDTMTNNDIRNVFRDLRTRLTKTQAGVINANGTETIYNTAQYEITD
mgnify:CR=1 FL=1